MEKVIVAVVGVITLVVALSFLLSWPIMWLWNNALVGCRHGVLVSYLVSYSKHIQVLKRISYGIGYVCLRCRSCRAK